MKNTQYFRKIEELKLNIHVFYELSLKICFTEAFTAAGKLSYIKIYSHIKNDLSVNICLAGVQVFCK